MGFFLLFAADDCVIYLASGMLFCWCFIVPLLRRSGGIKSARSQDNVGSQLMSVFANSDQREAAEMSSKHATPAVSMEGGGGGENKDKPWRR